MDNMKELIMYIAITPLGVVVTYYLFLMVCQIGMFGKYGQLTFGHNGKYSYQLDSVATKTVDGYEKGDITVVDFKEDYYIEFSNGARFWIGNKYYAYGSDYEIPSEKFYIPMTNRNRISLKNALRLIKIEKELNNT